MSISAHQQNPTSDRAPMPAWCHHHGSKMRVIPSNRDPRDPHVLTIAGSAARVRIYNRRMSVHDGWYIDWEVTFSQQERATGRIFFTTDVLRAAFGLSEGLTIPGGTAWLLQQFDADNAWQGRYIRKGLFLNIPCPGTGHDGDPNVSIHLDETIKAAVRKLIES